MAISTIGNSGTSLPLPSAQQGDAAPAVKMPVAVPEPAPQQQPPSREQLQKAMESIKQAIEAKAPNSLSFSIDQETGETIVRITDSQTGDVIRQIPSEEMLAIARSVDRMQGLLLKQEA